MKKLFDKQSVKVQDDIFHEYLELHQANPESEKYKRKLNRDIFIKRITEVKDSFVFWRYVHEKEDPSIRPGTLTYFRLSLKKVTKKNIEGIF